MNRNTLRLITFGIACFAGGVAATSGAFLIAYDKYGLN